MLRSKFRISRSDLESFFKGKSFFAKGNIVSLRFKKDSKDYTRWAFVVTSAKKRTAVSRNTARRRMSEITMEIQDRTQAGLDIVFFLKLPDKNVPSYKSLKDDIIHLLTQKTLYV